MSQIIRFLLILGFLIGSFCSTNAREQPDTLRVLAIGNSFSQDAVEQYLYELAAAADKPIIIANMYIGGAPLSLHWENADADKAAYRDRKSTRLNSSH